MVISAEEESEKQQRLDLAVRTGLPFPEETEGLFCGVLDSFLVQELRDGHAAVPCRFSTGDKTVGWSYVTADPYAESGAKVWRNGEDPGQHGQAVASALHSQVENGASKAGARVMVIDTSDQALLTRAPASYLTVRVATDSPCQPEFTPSTYHVASEDCRPCRHHPRQAPPTPLAPTPVWPFRI
jgi:hypothetical protein